MKTQRNGVIPLKKEISINDKSDFILKSSFNALEASLLTHSLFYSPSHPSGDEQWHHEQNY